MCAPFYGTAQAQCRTHTIMCSLKSGCGTHFNRKSSYLQAGDEDLRLKQVPCPLFSEFFAASNCTSVRGATLRLGGTVLELCPVPVH